MVFVIFHNMNRKKNSNVAFKLKQTQKVSLYNKSKQYYNHSSKMFNFLFFYLCTVYLKKMFVLSFSFLFHMLRSTIFKLLFFLFFFSFFYLHCPVAFFFFLFFFSVFIFFFFLFFFRFIINCSFNVSFFFQPYIYLSLSLP